MINNQKNEIKTLQLEVALGTVLILGLIVYFIEYKRRVRKNQQQEFKQHIYEISKLKMQNIREKISPHFLFNVLNNEINQHPESTSEHQRLIRLTRLLRKGLDMSNRLRFLSLKNLISYPTMWHCCKIQVNNSHSVCINKGI